MKPLLIALTLLASVFTKDSLASEADVAPRVLRSFQTTFTNATDVDWTVTENLYKAQFSMAGQIVTAYFNNNGVLQAITRNVTSHQLPIGLQANLKKDYNDYWISDLFEITNDEGTHYYVTLECADSKVVLKSTSGTDWSTFQKVKKS